MCYQLDSCNLLFHTYAAQKGVLVHTIKLICQWTRANSLRKKAQEIQVCDSHLWCYLRLGAHATSHDARLCMHLAVNIHEHSQLCVFRAGARAVAACPQTQRRFCTKTGFPLWPCRHGCCSCDRVLAAASQPAFVTQSRMLAPCMLAALTVFSAQLVQRQGSIWTCKTGHVLF